MRDFIKSDGRCEQALELLPDAVLIERSGRIVYANSAAAKLLGAPSPVAFCMHNMLTFVAPQSRAAVVQDITRLRDGATDRISGHETGMRLDGTKIELEVTRASFLQDDEVVIQMMARDISASKRLENELNYLATHDPLTGLPNRTRFIDRLAEAMFYARRCDGQFRVCFLDLDRFKWINDSLGHEAGDLLLKVVAARIRGTLREIDVVARLSGDEFVLLLHDTESTGVEETILNRVIAALSAPIQIGGSELYLTCSIGYCVYPGNGDTPEELIMRADAAMYVAKEKGRNKIQSYADSELMNKINRRIRLSIELQRALERNELDLHYQPQVELRTRKVIGVEALIRWTHPELGTISPAEFVPIAEDNGLIIPIGEWVVQKACQQNRDWQRAGLPPVRVAVNLSPRQLSRPGFDEFILGCLRQSELEAHFLELEFTEGASMDDHENILPLMKKLKKLGVALSIDDFGTGYSNMRYLKHFPIDRLKLDGSFVKEITTDPRTLAIVDAIMTVSHRLGLEVIAEMAETESQVSLLAQHGCDQVQGYYFSRPVPATECGELLRTAFGVISEPICEVVHT